MSVFFMAMSIAARPSRPGHGGKGPMKSHFPAIHFSSLLSSRVP